MQIIGNSTDVTAAVQAAILTDNVELSGICLTTGIIVPSGRRLHIPFGSVLQGTTAAPVITIGGDNILIDGDGTINGGPAVNAISHAGQSHITIRDVVIRNTVQSGIQLLDGSFLTVKGVDIKDVGVNCITYYFDGSHNAAQSSDLVVRDCKLDKRSTTHDLPAQHAALLSYGGTGNRTLTNVDVSFNTVTGKGTGAGNGIEFLSSNTCYPNHINMKFIGNTISYCSLGLTGGNSPNVVMNSNTIFGCHGMAMEISAWGASLTGNAIDGFSRGGGILADGGFTGIFGTGIVINANSIINTIGAAIQTSALISGVIVSNNMIRVNSGRGVFPQGTSQANMFITGNFFDGATVGNIAIDMPPGNHPFYIVNNKFMRWTTANINGPTGADTISGNF